jgi:D-alanyl-D-alanine dipeptidase
MGRLRAEWRHEAQCKDVGSEGRRGAPSPTARVASGSGRRSVAALVARLTLSLGAAPVLLTLPTTGLALTVPPRPAPCPERWRGLLGAYGGPEGPLVREEGGRLEVILGSGAPRTLEPIGPDSYRITGPGPEAGRTLAFARSAPGQATSATLDGASLPRRDRKVEGAVFRITPRRPVADLRREALAGSPPRENGPFRPSELVDAVSLEPGLRLDIRYATEDNFLGVPVYPSSARAFLQRPAAEALVRAHRALRPYGYGLLIHDAYRPWWVTRVFWDATPPDKREFVADPAKGSRHNRGCAVDLTLYRLADGRAAEMPGVYDEMSERSYPSYRGGTSLQRWRRDLLRAAMEAEGFTVFSSEWWHFDYRGWREYPILNVPFDAIAP